MRNWAVIRAFLCCRAIHPLLDTITHDISQTAECYVPVLGLLLQIIKTTKTDNCRTHSIKIYAVTAVKVAIVRTIGTRKGTPNCRLCFCKVLANRLQLRYTQSSLSDPNVQSGCTLDSEATAMFVYMMRLCGHLLEGT